MRPEDERLIRRLVDAAESLETELSQEWARAFRDEEQRQVEAITDELETLGLAIPFDTDDEAISLRPGGTS